MAHHDGAKCKQNLFRLGYVIYLQAEFCKEHLLNNELVTMTLQISRRNSPYKFGARVIELFFYH